MPYANSPIREAVFDIRIDSLDINKTDFEAILSKIVVSDYLHKHNLMSVKSNFTLQDTGFKLENKDAPSVTGVVFTNKTNNRKIQFRLDGFTYNILKPYLSWESHFNEFLTYWQIYNETLKPKNITRIATRFINRIEIPLELRDFDDYIKNMPPIPICLKQTYLNFFMQVTVPCPDNASVAILTETIEEPQKDKLPFILDIDVFQTNNIVKAELVRHFNGIRIIKNDIFEKCITDKTRELFK
ncbi:MAG: TIGR04255 family protein [bacterium]|nr:TIGR04255 family protein [bacterium]